MYIADGAEVDLRINEMMWEYALLIKAAAAAKVAECPYLLGVSLCSAHEKHCRERF